MELNTIQRFWQNGCHFAFWILTSGAKKKPKE
jgi:hypothetical protein